MSLRLGRPKMDRPENPLVCRKRVVAELAKGKASAAQLQAILRKPPGEDRLNLVAQLTLEIGRSFTQAIFDLASCGGSPQIAAVSARSGLKTWNNKKTRRGRYNKRNGDESWTNMSKTMEDGGAWRKYGQKNILKSQYPRCYFRCTHKYVEGCRATKQVERTSDGMYHTTYYGRHTCNNNTVRVHFPHTSTPPPNDKSIVVEPPRQLQEEGSSSKDEEMATAAGPQCEISAESKSPENYHGLDDDEDEGYCKSIWEDLMVSTCCLYTARSSSSTAGFSDLDDLEMEGLDTLFPIVDDDGDI